MEVRLQTKRECLLWIIFGIFIFFTGVVCLKFDPVGQIIDQTSKMTEGSPVHRMWEKVPVEILMKVYVFNITNPAEFLNGTDKDLKLQEVGPYVFRETRRNLNIKFNSNGTVSFTPNVSVEFLPERSAGDPSVDLFYVPNIPLLGLYSMNSDANIFKKFGLKKLTKNLRSELILHLTADEFFWGYEDRLVRLAEMFTTSWIDFKKFGLMDRMYANQNDVVTMDLHEGSKLYTIDMWNGKQGLSHWNYTQPNTSLPCNTLENAYEGAMFPPNMPRDTSIIIYKKIFCRTLALNYIGSLEMPSGLTGYSYELPPSAFSCENPDNSCYCPKDGKKGLPNGFTDVTPCYYGLPIAISIPHFYGADTTDVINLQGMHPDKAKHSSRIIIQPNIGLPMEVTSKTQVNLVLRNLSYFQDARPFSNMYVPLIWTDACIEGLPEDIIDTVLLAYKYLPLAQMTLGWVFTAVGVSLVLYKAMLYMQIPNEDPKKKKNSAPIVYYAPVSISDKNEKCDLNELSYFEK